MEGAQKMPFCPAKEVLQSFTDLCKSTWELCLDDCSDGFSHISFSCFFLTFPLKGS